MGGSDLKRVNLFVIYLPISVYCVPTKLCALLRSHQRLRERARAQPQHFSHLPLLSLVNEFFSLMQTCVARCCIITLGQRMAKDCQACLRMHLFTLQIVSFPFCQA